MHVYYRISDKGNPKEKLPNATKFFCLLNAIEEFGKQNIFVIADNCTDTTLQFFRDKEIEFVEQSLGNAKSFVFMVQYILEHEEAANSVYLLEDDYLHLKGSLQCLLEGLEIADYVTLYDHPDKYLLASLGGNPFNYKNIQKSSIFYTPSSHWRTTNSTTMTFACKVNTLRIDFCVWKKYLEGRSPDDFNAFVALTQFNLFDIPAMLIQKRKRTAFIIMCNAFFHRSKKRLLLSSLPSHATHGELAFLAPVINWKSIQ